MQKWPVTVIQRIKELEHKIKNLENENKELKGENKELKDKIDGLEKKLRMYENPHTPSSQQRFKGNSGSDSSSNKRRGAPKGHNSATRKMPEPDEVIPVPSNHCPKCGCDPGIPKGFEPVTIEELPPPQKGK